MPTTAHVTAVVANRSQTDIPAEDHVERASDEQQALLDDGSEHSDLRSRRKAVAGGIALCVCVSIGLAVLVVIFAVSRVLRQSDAAPSEPVFHNGMGVTPTMGWNSWNRYGCTVNESVVLAAAEALKSSGLADLGYTHVTVDDCWQLLGRNDEGDLIPDPVAFPSGMAALGKRIHGLGLRFGIYSSAGTKTCAGRAASLDHEDRDAQLFATWGVDLLKMDNCHNKGQDGSPRVSFARYAKMARALNDTGRPINYALCSWGEDSVEDWAPQIANSYRMSRDIYNNREPGNFHHRSYLQILEQASTMIHKSRSPTFADLDMLEVGNGLSDVDGRSHFSLWAVLKSPLILGNDLTNMDRATRETITNRHLIAVNQDSLGRPATLVQRPPDADVDLQWWIGPLSGQRWVVAVLNTGEEVKMNVGITIRDLVGTSATIRFRDLWQDRRKVGDFSDSFHTDVGAHAVRVFELSRA